MDLDAFDPFNKDILANPYPWYRELRNHAPCHFIAARNLWVVSRYDDVVACARNHGVFSSTGGVGFDWEQRPMMPMYDPPQHTRVRRLVSKHFTPAAVALRAESQERAVARLLQPALEQKRVDLVSDVAIPVSLNAIADLYGMPEERRRDLRRWSQGVVEELAGGLDPEATARVDILRKEFVGFLRETIAERRAHPRPDANDVLSLVMAAEDDDKLTDREVVAFGVLLLTAGFETTVNAMANGVLALITHPDEWQKAITQPELVPSLIEEIVRWDCPVQSFFRNTLSETTVAGVAIPKGVKVQLLFGSANRDERRFPNADDFKIDREGPDHVGYGVGVHFCLGAPLARLQLGALFSALVKSISKLELDGEVVRAHSVLFRGVRRLPLRIEPR
jgi:cytochrome P450